MTKKILIIFIRLYRSLNSFWKFAPLPFPSAQCRFHPSCSEYAEEVIIKEGLFFGGLKAAYRVLRCNPLTESRVDLP